MLHAMNVIAGIPGKSLAASGRFGQDGGENSPPATGSPAVQLHEDASGRAVPRRSLTGALQKQPAWVLWLALLSSSVGLGYLDYIFSWEVSLFVFYALPIMAAVWTLGKGAALFMALVSGIVWWFANRADHPYQTQMGYAWAMVSRMLYFAFVAIGAAAIRHKQQADAEKIRMLEELRKLETDILAVGENERQRIGQDLHDGLCQQLAAIGCAARVLADDLQRDGRPEADDAAQIEQAMQQAASEARSLARGIFPVHVDQSGLQMALQELAGSTERLTGIPITLVRGAEEVRIPSPETAMHLFRIAQEAVANAVKHSGASRICIQLQVDGSLLRLSVDDDGIGIAQHGILCGSRMGLRTMNYRAQSIGAALRVARSRSGGTEVVCELNLSPTPGAAKP